jgi:hypothetical protein
MSRTSQAILLGVATFGCLVLLPLGVVGAIASPIVFDNPRNLEQPLAWIAFLFMLSLWVICILAPFGAWVAFAKRRQPLQWLAIGAPFAWLALTAASMAIARV